MDYLKIPHNYLTTGHDKNNNKNIKTIYEQAFDIHMRPKMRTQAPSLQQSVQRQRETNSRLNISAPRN